MTEPSGVTKEDEAYAENIYLMAAILDPAFAFHWVDAFVCFKGMNMTEAKETKEDLKKITER